MSAHEQLRQMLDQLMGTGRDGENNRYKVQFTDPRVCKSFLLGCCPHDILASTRMDLGECPKIHDLALRADYEAGSKTHDYYYDIDAMEHLQSFIADCDRRTELAKRRLAETQEELSTEVTVKANIVHQLGEEIGKKLAKAEQLGAEGNVDESLKLMEEIEEFRNKKMQAEMDYRNSMPASSYQQQKLRVCEVCSAYLGIHDNDRRLADHFGGKLHLGFITIREKLEDLKKSVAEKREKREQERANRFDNRDRDRDKERERSDRDRERERGDRDRGDRDRERDMNRDRRFKQGGGDSRPGFRGGAQSQNRSEGGRRRTAKSPSRSRSRDRKRRKSRSRSKDRRRKSRSRSKSRRSKSHSSKRSRSRSHSRYSKSREKRKSRESSRDRHHKPRERSEERKHSRSRERSDRKRDSKSQERERTGNARSPSSDSEGKADTSDSG